MPGIGTVTAVASTAIVTDLFLHHTQLGIELHDYGDIITEVSVITAFTRSDMQHVE